MRWLPFTVPKFSEKKVDFVAVSLVIPLAQDRLIQCSESTETWFLWICNVTGSAYCVRCRRCQIPQRHWYPRLHLQHLHGWQVPMYLCANFSHHGLQAGCIFKYLTSFSNHICFFPVPGASTTQMETFWLVRKRACRCFSLSSLTRRMIAQFPQSRFSFLDSLVSVSLCLFVSVVPQLGEILITTEFGKMMVEPNEICVIQVRPAFSSPRFSARRLPLCLPQLWICHI